MPRFSWFRTLIVVMLIVPLLIISSNSWAAVAVNMQTNLGTIVIELDQEKAPATVRNFINYVNAGFYNGTIFHRVIDNFIIQGGGYDESLQLKPTNPPIQNEANNGLKNVRYSVAMARTEADPHSATSQFYINLVDNPFLDFRAPDPRNWGNTVFGRVIQGMEVVDKIGRSQTHSEVISQNLPNETVVIQSATVVDTGMQTQ